MAEDTQAAGTTQNTDASQTAGTDQQAAVVQAAPTDAAQGDSTTQQQTDAQATDAQGDKPADGTDSKADTPKAPEKYEFKAPEGVTLDDGVMAEFSAVAKELDLPQDAAQKLVDKMLPKIAQRNADAFQAQLQQARVSWQDATKADKEFGGDKLNENLSVAKKALDAFGSPELRTLLETTGLGDNPEIIRAFYRAGKAISEDTVVPGTSKPAAGGQRDHATALYGTQS